MMLINNSLLLEPDLEDLMSEYQNVFTLWEIYNNLLKEVPQSNQFILPWWRTLIWAILFTLTIVISIGGNLIVIWIVVAHREMRTVTNYFLVQWELKRCERKCNC